MEHEIIDGMSKPRRRSGIGPTQLEFVRDMDLRPVAAPESSSRSLIRTILRLFIIGVVVPELWI